MTEKAPEAVITILLVDDSVPTRENVKKLLSFERDLKVVAMAGTGAEGIALAKEFRPDIIIMDINMPDMDGLEATTRIVDSAPGTGIIILSAQDDQRYMRQSMLAGAKAFLTKPSSPDEIYNTVRAVHKRAPVMQPALGELSRPVDSQQTGAGHVVVVYSPQGGAGCTTIATNLAAGLMRDGVRVLLVDANLQFGDIGVFLNLKAQSTLLDLVEDVDDLDTDYFENSLVAHNSGLKVLMGPQRPEDAEKAMADPLSVSKIIGKIRWSYDFIVVDTSLHLDEMTLSLFDIASRIVLVSTPTLASVKNIRSVLDLFDQLHYPQNKTAMILNRVSRDQGIKKLALSPENIANFLKRKVEMTIPAEDLIVLEAVRKGIPVIASQRDRTKSPIKELLEFANFVYNALVPEPGENGHTQPAKKAPSKLEWGRR
jgi:pilus assembly protein CpaE